LHFTKVLELRSVGEAIKSDNGNITAVKFRYTLVLQVIQRPGTIVEWLTKKIQVAPA